jgi:hypothetical protein
MASDGFTRCIEDVDRALVIATSRRTLAVQELNRAHATVDQAEQALMRAEQEKLLRERHVEMCDRSIAGLLDERIRARAAEAEKVAAG